MNHELRLCTREELRTVYGIPWSDTHLNRKIQSGMFPGPRGRNCHRARRLWLCAIVEAWIRGDWTPPVEP